MPNAAIVATTVTTPDSKPFRLFIAGEDVMKGTQQDGVPLNSIEFESAGANSPARLSFDHEDPAKIRTIGGHAEVRYWDQAAGEDIFGGYLLGRTSSPAFGQQGRLTQLIATDWSLELDRNLVTGISYPAGLSDQALVQGICGNFLVGTLSYSSATVALTNAAMPAMTFEPQSVRAALEQIAAAANGDGQGERSLWVDAKRRINYRLAISDTAPYLITDNPTLGTHRAPEDLELVDDDSAIYTAVYVLGANAAGSGWVTNGANIRRYGWRADFLDVPDSDSAVKREQYGQSWLAVRSTPTRRGTFSILNTTGWKAGQQVTISIAALGISQPFTIKHVTGRPVGGTPVYRHTIEFGARKPGMIRSNVIAGGFRR
jgi:hypothetical protein